MLTMSKLKSSEIIPYNRRNLTICNEAFSGMNYPNFCGVDLSHIKSSSN
jgi:hypothetical protein